MQTFKLPVQTSYFLEVETDSSDAFLYSCRTLSLSPGLAGADQGGFASATMQNLHWNNLVLHPPFFPCILHSGLISLNCASLISRMGV